MSDQVAPYDAVYDEVSRRYPTLLGRLHEHELAETSEPAAGHTDLPTGDETPRTDAIPAAPHPSEGDPFAWPIFPISTAPRDRRILVWVPHRGHREGHWVFAKWFNDERPGPDMSAERWTLVKRHGGYWSAKPNNGGRPLARAPTLWFDLPDPEAP
jgi:hypothetical protein